MKIIHDEFNLKKRDSIFEIINRQLKEYFLINTGKGFDNKPTNNIL